MAAQILIARGVELGPIEEHVATAPPKYQREPPSTSALNLRCLDGRLWSNPQDLRRLPAWQRKSFAKTLCSFFDN